MRGRGVCPRASDGLGGNDAGSNLTLPAALPACLFACSAYLQGFMGATCCLPGRVPPSRCRSQRQASLPGMQAEAWAALHCAVLRCMRPVWAPASLPCSPAPTRLHSPACDVQRPTLTSARCPPARPACLYCLAAGAAWTCCWSRRRCQRLPAHTATAWTLCRSCWLTPAP